MDQRMRALLHVHSRYSYDGVRELSHLADWGRSRHIQILFLSEHTDDFDQGKMERFVAECDSLADRPCRLVPGLEFTVRGGFHILGYGIRRFQPILGVEEAVRFIKDSGGIAVLAHPARYRGKWPEPDVLRLLDGIEVWNARYDGRFMPCEKVLSSCQDMFDRFPNLLAFGGQDLHDTGMQGLIGTHVSGSVNGLESFWLLVRHGNARLGRWPIKLDSHPPINRLVRRVAAIAHPLYKGAKQLRDARF